jgi:hypothetical protein
LSTRALKKIIFLAVGTTLLSSIVVLYGLPPANSGGTHELLHESFAAPYPVDIQKVYSKREVSGAINGSPHVIVHESWVNTEISCEFCMRIEVPPSYVGNVELAFASDKIHGYNDAKKLSFFIMGEDGDEIVKFKTVGKKNLDKNSKLSRTTTYEMDTEPVPLRNDWQKIELDVSKVGFTGITSPLAIQALEKGGSDPMIFYVKAIWLENKIADNPLPVKKSKDS